MKICKIEELVSRNFNTVFINALKQFWHTTKSFQCICAPKKLNLFLYLDGCKITYTDRYGRVVTANSGDIVYTPVGSEYRANLFDFENEDSHTIGVNFLLYDENGEEVVLSNDIKIFRLPQNKALPHLFRSILFSDINKQFTQNRIFLMEILLALATRKADKKIPKSIRKAISYLSEHIEESPTVAALAELCNISEVYFRKQFKTCMGVSPHEYRNSLRLQRAQTYLEYGEISVQEISDMLGYSTVSHFIKEFKKRYGISPLKYRKLEQSGLLSD